MVREVKRLNTASSDSELARYRAKPLYSSAGDLYDAQCKSSNIDSAHSSKTGLFLIGNVKQNVSEKVAQVSSWNGDAI